MVRQDRESRQQMAMLQRSVANRGASSRPAVKVQFEAPLNAHKRQMKVAPESSMRCKPRVLEVNIWIGELQIRKARLQLAIFFMMVRQLPRNVFLCLLPGG